MAHGGARPNAGRKPGSLSRFNREMVERASSGGDLPLDFMLEVMRDESLGIRLRIDAAKAAAPYYKAAQISSNSLPTHYLDGRCYISNLLTDD